MMPTHLAFYIVDKRMGLVGVAAVVEWSANVPGAVVGVGSIPARAIFFFNFLELLLLL